MSASSELHFAHFEVLAGLDGKPEELGRGAMGVTYRAFDRHLQRDEALKVINPAQGGDLKARALFLREARAAARVHHGNVGSVVFLNADDPDHLFYAMEYIAGESLRDWLHSRVPLEPRLAIGLALQLARGLEAIHQEGIIHRDLKPGNVMVLRLENQRPESDPEAWRLKIIDFGLARPMSGDVSESTAAAVTTGFRGTALYASPEQCEERRDLDGRTDQYALGCMLWEMLVGAPPFRANVHRELLNAHVAKPLPLAQLSHLSGGVQSIVKRLLAKDREQRYPDDRAVVADLEACLWRLENGLPDTAMGEDETVVELPEPAKLAIAKPPTRAGLRGDPPVGRRPIIAGTASVVVVGALGLLGFQLGWFKKSASGDAPSSQWTNPVVAVLPFNSTDGDKKEQALADALTTEVINRISQLPNTRVIPQTAITAYRTSPGGAGKKRVKAIDAELGGVSAVLESSIVRQNDEYRINSVLYDAKTEQRLWGHEFRREAANVSLPQELPDRIAREVRIVLETTRRQTPEQRLAAGPTAADLYFQAFPLDISEPKRQEMMDEAFAKDPKFADALAESALYDLSGDFSEEENARRLKQAEEKCQRALALDPNCVPALRYLGWLKRDGKDTETEGLKLIERVLELSPFDFRANLLMAFQAEREGRIAEAYEYVRRAYASDPDIRRLLNMPQYIAKDFGLTDIANLWLDRKIAITNDLKWKELLGIQQLLNRGEYERAYDRLKLLPDNLRIERASVPGMRMEALLGLGRDNEVLALIPETDENLLERARLLVRLGRIDEARQVAQKSLEKDQRGIAERLANGEEVIRGYYRAAQAQEILGRHEEALANVQRFAHTDARRLADASVINSRDFWIFEKNPKALEILQGLFDKAHQNDEAIRRRIREIEESYAGPITANSSGK